MKRLLFVLPLVLLLGGCKDNYGACAKAGADIATGISSAMTVVDSTRAAGGMSVAEESSVLAYLKFANDADGAFLTCVAAAKAGGNKSGTYTACTTAFSTALDTPSELALVKVSNPQTEQTITTTVNGISTAVAAISAALGGA
jgi:hypothetical protein